MTNVVIGLVNLALRGFTCFGRDHCKQCDSKCCIPLIVCPAFLREQTPAPSTWVRSPLHGESQAAEGQWSRQAEGAAKGENW